MSDINVTVTGSKRLKLAGKFCDKDVVVTALGGDTDIKIQSSKTVTPTKTQQTVRPDSGYDVLSSVTVNKIPDKYIEPTETMDIDENGTYDVTACKTVNVRVAGSVDLICSVGDTFFSDAFLEGYDVNSDTMDCSVTPSGILSATLESDYYSFEALAEGSATIHFAFLEYSGDETIYIDVSVVVTAGGSGLNLQEKTVTPTKSQQTIEPDSGYDGLSSVIVEKIPSNYLIPSGTKTLSSYGTHDVGQFAKAKVAEGALEVPSVEINESTGAVEIKSKVKTSGYLTTAYKSSPLTDANLIASNIKKN